MNADDPQVFICGFAFFEPAGVAAQYAVGVILSSSHSGGYWVSDYEPEIKEFNQELISRIKKLQKILIHNEQFLLLKSRMDRR